MTATNNADNEHVDPQNEVDSQVQSILDLMVARSRGEVSSNAVENAVSQFIQVQPDQDDYDDIEPVPSSNKNQSADNASEKDDTGKEFSWLGPMVTLQQLKEQDDQDADVNPFDAIPLGHDGRKMLVTFGDGPSPHPMVVQAALLGARRMLQLAIKDARALRRYYKGEYGQARKAVHGGNQNVRVNKLTRSPVVTKDSMEDASLLFRALVSHDRLAYDPKCGFDIEQLQELFPEEMNAYERWNEFHEEYEASKDTPDEIENDQDGIKKESDQDDKDVDDVKGGHLLERVANFDSRTNEMGKEWYLQFSDLRQGSFLPRRSNRQADRELDENRPSHNARGRARDGHWNLMPLNAIRFLHWVGFDPQSALPAPSLETTHALSFLCYDFLGRIVERAIALRLESTSRQSKTKGEKVLELPQGQQLEVEDIRRAMKDIKPSSLFSSSDATSKPESFQLYFGEGFERRLEMEMDE
jgi:hypothetical protein